MANPQVSPCFSWIEGLVLEIVEELRSGCGKLETVETGEDIKCLLTCHEPVDFRTTPTLPHQNFKSPSSFR